MNKVNKRYQVRYWINGEFGFSNVLAKTEAEAEKLVSLAYPDANIEAEGTFEWDDETDGEWYRVL